MADLVEGFRWRAGPGRRRGVSRASTTSRGGPGTGRPGDRAGHPAVTFDFGAEAPAPESSTPRSSRSSGTGSVLAPETGDYEFVVRTENSARLHVNDLRKPADRRDGPVGHRHRAPRVDLPDRRPVYPVRLEYSKAKQGVNDSKEKKEKAPSVKASVALEWKLPNRVVEPIPTHCLWPGDSPEVFVPATPSRRTTGASATTGGPRFPRPGTRPPPTRRSRRPTMSRPTPRAGRRRDDAPDRPAKLRAFCRKFAERAFRRPLTAEQAERLGRPALRRGITPRRR